MRLDENNLDDNLLSYVSKKTGIEAQVPISENTAELIRLCVAEHEQRGDMARAQYNRTIKELCEMAGITQRVKIFRAGRELSGAKCTFVSSHTARRSFATNLHLAGLDILTIARMMGHTDTTTTERYICRSDVNLTGRAKSYLFN
jgi:site-specific recombinase XerD